MLKRDVLVLKQISTGLGHLIDEMSRYLVDHLRESKRDVKQKHTEDKLLQAARILEEQRNLGLIHGLAVKNAKIPTNPVIRSRDQGR